MESGAFSNRGIGPRHSILDLAPLELECLSVLWPAGESTVRDIYRQLLATRPRAYTTVMTIMDRLARKGIVTRRKAGRAYRYQANLSAAEARTRAVEKIVQAFFDGSSDALAAHLAAQRGPARLSDPSPAPSEQPQGEARAEVPELPRGAAVDGTGVAGGESATRRLDESLR